VTLMNDSAGISMLASWYLPSSNTIFWAYLRRIMSKLGRRIPRRSLPNWYDVGGGRQQVVGASVTRELPPPRFEAPERERGGGQEQDRYGGESGQVE